ncbi:MAG: peptide ABC transporter substrate-binding protein [Verrucomicrobiales bacterium]
MNLRIPAVGIAVAVLGVSCNRDESRILSAAREKILLIGNGTEMQSLDPHTTTGVQEHHVFTSILEGLVDEHPSEETVAPGVAERWESNEGLNVWTFHLRKNAKWSNGDPVTARDFVFAYRRMLIPKLASPYAEMLYLLKGAQELHAGKTSDFSTLGARALDDHTLQLELVGPIAYFPIVLPHYAWFPIHEATILKFGAVDQRATRWTRPGNFVGNGAFKLKSWRFKHFLEVERNPHYWDAANVKLNGIRYFPVDNTAAEERMFRDGHLHKTEILPLDKIDYWREQRPEFFRADPYLSVYFYRVNTTRPQLKDPRVRRALALAVDRESICRNIMRAGQTPCTGMVPPVAGYVGPNKLRFDPPAARQLLAEAGFPEGRNFPRFDILMNVMEQHKIIAEAIQQMWKKHLNIDVGINAQDWGVYLDSQQRLDYDVCRAGWTADYADPMTFLDLWTAGNGNNETGWSRPEFDALIAQARQTADQKARFDILRRAEEILLDEMPIVPFYVYVLPHLITPMVTGWHPKLLDNHPWKHVGLAAPSR